MPVIGRLDEQVDDVLIKPVSKRRADHDARGAEKFPKAPPEPSAEGEPKEDAPARRPSELPVWLL